MVIFGTITEGITLSTNQADAFAFTTLLARRLILVNWRRIQHINAGLRK